MEEKYTIVEGYSLPSQSKIYAKQFDPHVELRSMTTREEMRRQSKTNRPYKMLADIIEACLIKKLPISVYDMCIGDYEYLLHKLRVVSYGPEYKMTVMCPQCGKIEEAVIDLDELKVLPYNDTEVKELMSFTLPVTGKLITIKYQTPRILDNIAIRKAELEKKGIDYDPTMSLTLQEVIETVDGQPMGFVALENFAQTLPVRDAKCIISHVNKLSRKVGLDTSINHTCSACGYELSTYFLFGKDFFRSVDDE